MSVLLRGKPMFLNKKKLAAIIVGSLATGSVLTVGGLGWLFGVQTPAQVAEWARFIGVKKFIELRYVEPVDDTDLMDGAIEGMVGSLGDPHSLYLSANKFKTLQDHTAASFGGIGVTMGFKNDQVTIISVLEGTPGEGAGLQVGDQIVAVDGTPVTDYQPDEVALHIRGDVDTQVTLTIHRAGQDDFDVQLTRAIIRVPTAKGKMLPDTDHIGYIRIASFGEHTAEEFNAAFDALADEGMRGLVIDLRENGGGLITTCVDIAQRVVPAGPIVSVVDRDGSREEHDSDLQESKYPLVVLIDGNSASASEILAGALQDTGAATLVGTKSYGKGSVQMVLPLFHDDGLKLTIAKYYTPAGRCIDGIGIEPDVEVDLPEGTTEDTQLQKAIAVMQEKMVQ